MKDFTIDNMTVKLRPDLLAGVVASTLIDQYRNSTNATLAATALAVLTTPKASGGFGFTQAYLDAIPAATTGPGELANAASRLAGSEALVKPLTIDVATTTDATNGSKSAGTTYVRIGLGSLEVAASSIDFTVALGNTKSTKTTTSTWVTSGGTPVTPTDPATPASPAAPQRTDLSQELGNVHIGNLMVDMNGNSTVDIYALRMKSSGGIASGTGVVFDLNVTIDKLSATAMSWGNTGASTLTGPSGSPALPANGATVGSTQGYVGLSNLNIGGLSFTGPVSIQVGTVDTSSPATKGALLTTALATHTGADTALSAFYYSLYNSIGTKMGSSFVHIGLGTGNSTSPGSTLANGTGAFVFAMNAMTSDVSVGNNADLLSSGTHTEGATTGIANTAGTYGSIGISNLKVGMNGWVNFGTH